MLKRMAALAMQHRIGQTFRPSSPAPVRRACSCASPIRRWKAASCAAKQGLDVGEHVRVSLLNADPAARLYRFCEGMMTTENSCVTPWPRSPIAAARPCVARPPNSPTFARCRKPRTPARFSLTWADLFDWAMALADGKHVWRNSPPLPWDDGMARFFAALEAFDRRLASDRAARHKPRATFPGSDRRRPHAYRVKSLCCAASRAALAALRITSSPLSKRAALGADQAAPVREFD